MLVIVKGGVMEEVKRRKFMKGVGISAIATAVISFLPFKKSFKEIKTENNGKKENIVIHPSAVKRNI